MWQAKRFLTCLLIMNVWLICTSKPFEKPTEDEENVWVHQIFDLSLKTLTLLRPYLIPTKPPGVWGPASGPGLMNETTSRRPRQINETTLPISGRRKFDPWGGKWVGSLKFVQIFNFDKTLFLDDLMMFLIISSISSKAKICPKDFTENQFWVKISIFREIMFKDIFQL